MIDRARFVDKTSGVVYHPMCFVRRIEWPPPARPEAPEQVAERVAAVPA
jgi:hypothetical protein